MTGLSRSTAARIDDDAHLSQSIHDILTTRIGSRVMRRDYGSELPSIIDQPMNGETLVDLFQATAEALARWEPRFKLSRVEVLSATAGRVVMTLTGDTTIGSTRIDTMVAA